MSIQDKATLLNRLENALGDVLTVAEMGRVMGRVADTLSGFSVQQIEAENPGKDDLLAAYISAMQIQGRSPKTIERYRYIIGRLMQAVKVSTREITVYHLRQYLSDEKARGICDNTLEGFRQVFSAYFNWLQREGLITQNPTANLGAIKCPKKVKQTYSDVDLEKLKFSAETLRDRAIVCFLMSTGCRISEMIQLNRDDVDLNALECTVLGKGNKERTVYIDAVTSMLIRQYLETRRDDEPALFIGKRRERLLPGGVRYMLRTLGEESHVEHVHPHKFRRTLATNLIRHGMPIQEVAAILGHDKIDTTMQYVVLDKTDVKNSYRKYA